MDDTPHGPSACGDNTEIERRLAEDGYVLARLIDGPDVARLRAAFDRLDIHEAPFITTTGHADRATAGEVHRLLTTVLGARTAAILPGTVGFAGAFMSKGASTDHLVEAHQDWTYVDEHRGRAYLVWCPLVDCGVESGTLHVVPGSHRWTDLPRGSDFPSPYRDVQDLLIDELAVPVDLPAGTAAIIDTALLHCSPPNRSTGVRPVAALAVAPAGLPLVHHRAVDPRRAQVFSVDEWFFSRHTAADVASHYPLIDEYPLRDVVFGEAEVRGCFARWEAGRADVVHDGVPLGR